jgi:hypothetical protein
MKFLLLRTVQVKCKQKEKEVFTKPRTITNKNKTFKTFQIWFLEGILVRPAKRTTNDFQIF